MRIPYKTMYKEFYRVLCSRGMEQERAQLCANLFAQSSLDGVYTHGLNRFPRFISHIDSSAIDINAAPEFTESMGVIERWNGNNGPGNLNAHFCMQRAIEMAKKTTIGCVALANTNHWMRPGAYGLMAAKENCIGILWTNTMPNMPAWGGKEPKLGNNPIVIAIPHAEGDILLDVAMSMFSYGKLESYARAGKELPVDGGFDKDGNITRDAAKIFESRHTMPIGYWKGSGLSLALDLIASTLSGGNSTLKVGEMPIEGGMSQVFLAISLDNFADQQAIRENITATLNDLQSSTPIDEGGQVYYPGQGMLRTREENLLLGMPVDEEIWNSVLAL